MDSAFDFGKDDVRQMKQRAKWHASWAVRLGIIGLLLLLPLAVEPFAAPAVSLAAIVLVLASSDAIDGTLNRAHRRYAIVLFLGVLAHVAWIPRMIEDGEPSPLLFVTLIGFMVVAIGSMATVWAQNDTELAMVTELHRAQARERLEQQRSVGHQHEDLGPLRREEIDRLAMETGGRGVPRTVAWKGTPDHVNTEDERHPQKRD